MGFTIGGRQQTFQDIATVARLTSFDCSCLRVQRSHLISALIEEIGDFLGNTK